MSRHSHLSKSERCIYASHPKKRFSEINLSQEEDIRRMAENIVLMEWHEGLLIYLNTLEKHAPQYKIRCGVWHAAVLAAVWDNTRILKILHDRDLILSSIDLLTISSMHGNIRTMVLAKKMGASTDRAFHYLTHPKAFKLWLRWGFTMEELIVEHEIQSYNGGAIIDFIVKWKHPFSMALFYSVADANDAHALGKLQRHLKKMKVPLLKEYYCAALRRILRGSVQHTPYATVHQLCRWINDKYVFENLLKQQWENTEVLKIVQSCLAF